MIGSRALDDQADIDVLGRHVFENLRRDARPVGDIQQRYLRNFLVARDADDFSFFHTLRSFTNPRAFLQVKARSHVDGDVVRHADFGGARMQDLGAAGRHLDRLFVRQLSPVAGIRHKVRIGRQHAVDIGADFTDGGIQRRRHRRAGDVAAAAAEGRHLIVVGHALEAGHNHDFALAQLLFDAGRVDRLNLRAVERAVGADVALCARQRDRRHTFPLQRQGERGDRHLFAGGQQEIVIAPVRVPRHLPGERHQLIGGFTHRRHGHHQIRRRFQIGLDAIGDRKNLLGSRHRASAVLLDNDRTRSHCLFSSA